jgi:hypothetical protein
VPGRTSASPNAPHYSWPARRSASRLNRSRISEAFAGGDTQLFNEARKGGTQTFTSCPIGNCHPGSIPSQPAIRAATVMRFRARQRRGARVVAALGTLPRVALDYAGLARPSASICRRKWVMIIRDYADFLNEVRKAKQVRIEALFYQEGNRTFEFDDRMDCAEISTEPVPDTYRASRGTHALRHGRKTHCVPYRKSRAFCLWPPCLGVRKEDADTSHTGRRYRTARSA